MCCCIDAIWACIAATCAGVTVVAVTIFVVFGVPVLVSTDCVAGFAVGWTVPVAGGCGLTAVSRGCGVLVAAVGMCVAAGTGCVVVVVGVTLTKGADIAGVLRMRRLAFVGLRPSAFCSMVCGVTSVCT